MTLYLYEGPVCLLCAHRHREGGPCASHMWGDECEYTATETCPVTTRPTALSGCTLPGHEGCTVFECRWAIPAEYVDDPAPTVGWAPYDGPPDGDTGETDPVQDALRAGDLLPPSVPIEVCTCGTPRPPHPRGVLRCKR